MFAESWSDTDKDDSIDCTYTSSVQWMQSLVYSPRRQASIVLTRVQVDLRDLLRLE